MNDGLLQGHHILVVEDEYLLADSMQRELQALGAHVVGPVASVKKTLALLDTVLISGAILDVSLDNDTVFPVAEALTARGIRFIFATGYSASYLPPTWRHVPRFEKPVDIAKCARALLGDDES